MDVPANGILRLGQRKGAFRHFNARYVVTMLRKEPGITPVAAPWNEQALDIVLPKERMGALNRFAGLVTPNGPFRRIASLPECRHVVLPR